MPACRCPYLRNGLHRSAPFCLFLLFVLPNNFHPMKLFDPQPQIPQAPMVLLRSTRVLTNSCSRDFGCQKLALCGICGCLCSSFFFRQHCSTQLPPRSLVLLHYCRVFIFFLLTFVKLVPLPPPPLHPSAFSLPLRSGYQRCGPPQRCYQANPWSRTSSTQRSVLTCKNDSCTHRSVNEERATGRKIATAH